MFGKTIYVSRSNVQFSRFSFPNSGSKKLVVIWGQRTYLITEMFRRQRLLKNCHTLGVRPHLWGATVSYFITPLYSSQYFLELFLFFFFFRLISFQSASLSPQRKKPANRSTTSRRSVFSILAALNLPKLCQHLLRPLSLRYQRRPQRDLYRLSALE